MPATYIVGIDVSVWKRHRQVVLVHDLSADPAHDGRIEVMAQWEICCQCTQRLWVANGAVDVSVVWLIAHWRLERC